ncbi:hypothetical protein V2P29_00040 [Mesomycoplasma hyorhinis]|uniref:hypothetical protein n=1 Tax=Mesomycoplasma hyorhinis TaxID=2100 RepID=UPI0011B5FBEB|nr:hypothetical protein EIH16_03680 [Mesomycoplasma hyorhinis]
MNDNFKVITQDYSSYLSTIKEAIKKFKTVDKVLFVWIGTVVSSVLFWILFFVGLFKGWGNVNYALIIIALILDIFAFIVYIRVKINQERIKKFLNSLHYMHEEKTSELVETLNLINTSIGINDLAMFQTIRQETTVLNNLKEDFWCFLEGVPLFFRKKHKEVVINFVESVESTLSNINQLNYRQWERNKQ